VGRGELTARGKRRAAEGHGEELKKKKKSPRTRNDRIRNLRSERGGGAGAADAAAARPDDEEVVVVLLAVGHGHVSVLEHLPRHGFGAGAIRFPLHGDSSRWWWGRDE
jgi:hypothetical protein